MKKILMVTALCMLAFVGQAQNMTDAANLRRYAQQNAGIKTPKVVFIGNSITDAWPRHSPDFFTNNNYVGRGISGQTAPQLLLRFRQDVVSLKPEAVVINIGTNDIALNSGPYDPEFTLDCIKSMAEIASANEIEVILSSVLPVKEYPWRKEVKDAPAKIDSLNAAIKGYAGSKGFAYIDYHRLMSEPDGAMRASYANDGVHPTKEGYAVMETEARIVIAQALKSKEKKGRRERSAQTSQSRKGGFVVGAGVSF